MDINFIPHDKTLDSVTIPSGMDCRIKDQLSPYRERSPILADNRVCHAPGDRCLGCDHYYGKASVCEYADPNEQEDG